jgi:ATP-dependent Clp protease ATP-binding subunit ClpA
MFERFTDRARRVVVLAQEESRMLNHNYIGTEHILLGLVHEGDGVAAMALSELDISLGAVREQVEEIVGPGDSAPTGHIPFTPRAKKVLELSLREALQLGHNYIGTEHILLGLIREGEGVAAQVLTALGADLERVRQTVIRLLSSSVGRKEATTGTQVDDPLSAITEATVTHEPGMRGPKNTPICPSCRSWLTETAAVETREVMSGDEPQVIKIAYCSNCGVALGIKLV